jgi:hypothetical protein
MCHYIHNVIIKLLYNDSKMTISISSHVRITTCKELISTNVIHISNIKILIIYIIYFIYYPFKNILDE